MLAVVGASGSGKTSAIEAGLVPSLTLTDAHGASSVRLATFVDTGGRVLDRLVRGFPGHPLHPPLTDATIGMYTLATGLAIISYAGYVERPAAHGTWLALVGGLIVTAPTALTGFFDWVTLEWSSPPWRTATLHLTAMLSATVLFALAAWQDKSGYDAGRVTGAGLVLAVLGFAALTLGGWLGGAIVFVHGVRVLGRRDAPASTAASPTPKTTTTEVQ